ncbi:unnamed protein product, partial [Ectocarpus fasciculatus]
LGGHPDEPLLLVQKLALDETDAIFGAFESRFLGYAADAGSWSSLPGGFSRWLEKYHRVALLGSRPVLVAVHGDDVCALEKELSLGGRVSAAAEGVTPDGIIGNIAEEPPASAVARNRRQATNERGKVSIPTDRVRGLRNAQRPPANGVHRRRQAAARGPRDLPDRQSRQVLRLALPGQHLRQRPQDNDLEADD